MLFYYAQDVYQKNQGFFYHKKTQNFMAPFYGWGSTPSRLVSLRGGSLLFTTKSPEVQEAENNID